MANKPEYVDLIGEATRQHRRRATPLPIVAKPEVEETSKLSRWPPAMIKQWKLRPDAVEAGVVEAEGLALGHTNKGRRRGALFISIAITNSGTDSASDATGRRGADRNRSRSPGSGADSCSRDSSPP